MNREKIFSDASDPWDLLPDTAADLMSSPRYAKLVETVLPFLDSSYRPSPHGKDVLPRWLP